MSNGGPSGSVERYLLLGIAVGGAIGVFLVLIRVFGIVIPAFVETICWIVVAVIVGLVAIKFIFKMMRS